MASFGVTGSQPDRLTGAFQMAPTDFPGGDFADFYAHCSAKRDLHLRECGVEFNNKSWPRRAIEHARICTTYIPVYRIHSKQYFTSGAGYPNNWLATERRRSRNDRYSPYGFDGLYFGLSLQAAENEARYYGSGTISSDNSMILVIECCFDNLLYLTCGVLAAVWQVVGLPTVESGMEMYLRILDPRTDNETTNRIGLWARAEGFSGLVFPSARYGQEEWLQRKKADGFTLVPAINFVDLGSHLCQGWPAPMIDVMTSVDAEINRRGGLDRCIPVFAEQNLVLFDSSQIAGDTWGVVYQTFPAEMRQTVLEQDDPKRFAKSYTYWTSDDQPPWV